MEDRIVIHAPTGKDARLASQALVRSGMDCHIYAREVDIATELLKGAGALLIVDEVLTGEFLKSLNRYMKGQQPWSDLPIVVLSKRGLDSHEMRNFYLQLGNVTLLERPVESITLVSAAASALRARKRQYEIREIDRRKDEFLAMLAHELRNPLAPISTASDLLRIPSLDRAQIQRTSEIISRQVQHMTGLINDLLDVSRVSRGLVTLEQTRLDARLILANAVEQVRPLIDARRHRLTIQACPAPAFVYGDQKRLIQIVTNLLNNAAKYTPEGGDIVLALEVDQESVVVSVIDNGIGMEKSVIDYVFDMFAQAERTSDRSQGGLGIGLALVKSLVGLHGGSVAAYSAGLGMGSRFTMSLPRIASSEVDTEWQRKDEVHISEKGQKVLVVDDNQDAAIMLAEFLEVTGYKVMVEHNARKAIERARMEAPDICLLDIGLPDMDGNELASYLRTQPETASSMLVAITGYGQKTARQKVTEAGFNHHFVKPVDMDKLLKALSAVHKPQ